MFGRCVLIMDELDWVCHPLKSELNFPIGPKAPLDFGVEADGKRWEVSLHLWGGIFGCATQSPPKWLKDDERAFESRGESR